MEISCNCGKKAAFYRANEGRHYCKDCFVRNFEKRAKANIREFGMVKPGDVVAVGLSGGKDSQSLLFLLHKVFGKNPKIKLVAVSIDEGIAGYRPESLRLAKKLCKSLGVEHRIFSYKKEFGSTLDQKLRVVGQERHDSLGKARLLGQSGLSSPAGANKAVGLNQRGSSSQGSSCTYCGVARRALLNKAARLVGATKLAVGHNLDDEAQAVILNFLRGDMARAGRLKPVNDTSGEFVPRVKPFRDLPEKEVGLYAIINGLEVQESECPYAKGHRFEIRDFLNQVESRHPGTKLQVLASSDRIAPAIQKLGLGKGGVGKCKGCGEPCSQGTCKACELWK